MSCMTVPDNHINALLSWVNHHDNNPTVIFTTHETFDPSDIDDLQRMAEILAAENTRSLNCRYNEEETPPRDIAFSFQLKDRSPVEILKACACYDYNSDQTGLYAQSTAAQIIRAIRTRAIGRLPGYREALWVID